MAFDIKNLIKINSNFLKLNKSFSGKNLAYFGVKIGESHWEASLGGASPKRFEYRDKGNSEQEIFEYLKKAAERGEFGKIVAAGLAGPTQPDKLGSRLWLELDIVPLFWSGSDSEVSAKDLAGFAEGSFTAEGLAKIVLTADREVVPSRLCVLDEYRKHFPDFAKIEELAERLKGQKIAFFSATPQGGGVALMRHAVIRLLRLLGVDAHWYVLSEDPAAFNVTKIKFHNILQAVAPQDTALTEADKKTYTDWISANAKHWQRVIKEAGTVVIDDPQPSGLVPHIRSENPDAKIIYRSHIHLVTDLVNRAGTAQHATWEFIWGNIQSSDCFISHPIDHFIPDSVPKSKVLYMPASTDPLDGLNKPLNEWQCRYYLGLFDELLAQNGQAPLDHGRPYMIQVARFDPSKGIPDLIEAYFRFRASLSKDKTAPQLVICGNGSVDDPEGALILSMVRESLNQEKFRQIANDIKVARLPHVDQMLNALLTKSYLVLQLSHKEGYEIKVSEALMKGKPVIAYRAGGIPLQVKDGKTGFLLEVGNTFEVADRMTELYANKSLYNEFVGNIRNADYSHVLTPANAARWMELFVSLNEKTPERQKLELSVVSQ